MARIRTVKPEFFRHEVLQELEINNPQKYPMFVFAGLWCHCDKNGVFEWKPRTLKLDILPFLDFEMQDTLNILLEARQIIKFAINHKEYGIIPSFRKHQRINGKESQEDSKFPLPDNHLDIEKQWGSNGEATETTGREGKGREGKGKGKEGKGKGKEGNGVLSSDDDFIKMLKENPAYKGIDIDIELGKMDAWLSTPKGRGRTKTKQFIVNWLNKADRPVNTGESKTKRGTAKTAGNWELLNKRQQEGKYD
jgi:hypothetical protein